MAITLDEIVRRLLVLGIPLVPAGCGLSGSSCPDEAPPPHEQTAVVQKPSTVDGGATWVTQASFELCASGGDCLPLCKEQFRYADVKSCARDDRDDAGMSPDQITLRAQVISICEGRRPEGFAARADATARCDLGAWLAHAAHAEASSVPAFHRLARELAAHRAPTALVRSARRAAHDERRHTTIMTALARRHGACAPTPASAMPAHVRPLRDIAIENAAEGCVRETLGAVVALWQATRAADPRVRAAMKGIARDEARHAELAWQVDAWAASKLPAAARAEVSRATDAAYDTLTAEITTSSAHRSSVTMRHQSGLPDLATMHALAAGLRAIRADLIAHA